MWYNGAWRHATYGISAYSCKTFEEFWDKTETPFGAILFGHQIIDNHDGSVNVKHTVSLESEDKQHLEFLSQVFSDVPQSIFILKKLFRKIRWLLFVYIKI